MLPRELLRGMLAHPRVAQLRNALRDHYLRHNVVPDEAERRALGHVETLVLGAWLDLSTAFQGQKHPALDRLLELRGKTSALVADIISGKSDPSARVAELEPLYGELQRLLGELGMPVEQLLTQPIATPQLEAARLQVMDALSQHAATAGARPAERSPTGRKPDAVQELLAHEPTLAPESARWAVQHRLPLTPELARGLRRLAAALDTAGLAAVLKRMEADAARAAALLTELGRGSDPLVTALLQRGDLDLLLDPAKCSAAEAAQVAAALTGSSKGVLTDLAHLSGSATLTTGNLLEVVQGVGVKRLDELVASGAAHPVHLGRIFHASEGTSPQEKLGSKGLHLLHEMLELQKQGKVVDLQAWVDFSVGKVTEAGRSAEDIGRTLGELREVKELLAEDPGSEIIVGGDAKALFRPPPRERERMPTFDLAVAQRPATAGGARVIKRSVEVTTAEEPVETTADLLARVAHAASKARERAVEDKLPIPGRLQTTIRLEFAPTYTNLRGNRWTIQSNGDYVEVRPGPAPPASGNLIDNLMKRLNFKRDADVERLDRIRFVRKDGTVLAVLEAQGGRWIRTR